MSASVASPRRVAGPPMIALALTAAIGVAALIPAGHQATDRTVAARTLLAATAADGSLTLRDAGTGALVDTWPGDKDSFVRGAFHALAVRRARVGAPPAGSFRLVRLASGRLLLLDASTRSTVELEAFGAANASAFGRLLPGGNRT